MPRSLSQGIIYTTSPSLKVSPARESFSRPRGRAGTRIKDVDDRYGQTILAALRGGPVRIPERLDPDLLFWKICEHGLAGLLAEAQRTAAPPLPEFARRVAAVAVAQRASVECNLAAARDAAAALLRYEIPAVFIKGAALAPSVYPAPGLRPFGDLDLLIHRDRLPAACAVLGSLGFLPESEPTFSPMETSLVREVPGALPVGIDLHWDLTEQDRLQAAVRVPVADVLARRRTAGGIPIPSLEDSLLLSAANLVRSRLDRMILVVDFARMSAAGPDWDAVLARAAAWKLRTALWLGLDLAERMFGAAFPRRAREELSPSGWRRRCITSLLEGTSLWARRKVRHRVVAYGLPLLCADSIPDAVRALGAGRRRVLGRLGFSAPRGG